MVMSHNIDQTSLGMTFATIGLQIVTTATNNAAVMIMTVLVGISTIAYNVVRIHKLLKKK